MAYLLSVIHRECSPRLSSGVTSVAVAIVVTTVVLRRSAWVMISEVPVGVVTMETELLVKELLVVTSGERFTMEVLEGEGSGGVVEGVVGAIDVSMGGGGVVSG